MTNRIYDYDCPVCKVEREFRLFTPSWHCHCTTCGYHFPNPPEWGAAECEGCDA